MVCRVHSKIEGYWVLQIGVPEYPSHFSNKRALRQQHIALQSMICPGSVLSSWCTTATHEWLLISRSTHSRNQQSSYLHPVSPKCHQPANRVEGSIRRRPLTSIRSKKGRRSDYDAKHNSYHVSDISDLLQQNECSFTVTAAYQRMVRNRWHSAQDAKSGTTRPVKLSLTLFSIVTTKWAGFVITVQLFNLFLIMYAVTGR